MINESMRSAKSTLICLAVYLIRDRGMTEVIIHDDAISLAVRSHYPSGQRNRELTHRFASKCDSQKFPRGNGALKNRKPVRHVFPDGDVEVPMRAVVEAENSIWTLGKRRCKNYRGRYDSDEYRLHIFVRVDVLQNPR